MKKWEPVETRCSRKFCQTQKIRDKIAEIMLFAVKIDRLLANFNKFFSTTRIFFGLAFDFCTRVQWSPLKQFFFASLHSISRNFDNPHQAGTPAELRNIF